MSGYQAVSSSVDDAADDSALAPSLGVNRSLGFDLLRLLAVILILFRHAELPPNAPWLFSILHRGGWSGVDLFFVLSGFLVSGLLFREHLKTGVIDAGRFLIRRGFKIYPSFWALILFTVIARMLTGGMITWQQVTVELLFIQNYASGLWFHLWSLAVEEHFYIGVAVLMMFLLRGKTRVHLMPRIFAVVAVVCLSLRILNSISSPVFDEAAFRYRTHIRVDSLLFGVLLAYLYHYRGIGRAIGSKQAVVLTGVGILFFVPVFIFEVQQYRWVSVIGGVGLYIGSGCFVMAALGLQSGGRIATWLGQLGAASYSIYLWQGVVLNWGMKLVLRVAAWTPFWLYLSIYFLGALALGYAMNAVVERPMLALRDKLWPGRKTKFP